VKRMFALSMYRIMIEQRISQAFQFQFRHSELPLIRDAHRGVRNIFRVSVKSGISVL